MVQNITNPKQNAPAHQKKSWFAALFFQFLGNSNHQSLHESTISPHPKLPHVVLEGKGQQSPHSPRRSVSRKGCVNQISRCRNVDLRCSTVFFVLEEAETVLISEGKQHIATYGFPSPTVFFQWKNAVVTKAGKQIRRFQKSSRNE